MGRSPSSTPFEFHVPLPGSFDFRWVAGFLGPRAVASMERIDSISYRRAVRLSGRAHSIELRFERPAEVSVRARPTLGPAEARGAVGRMLDLDGHAEAFHDFARRDPFLSPVIARGRYVRLPALIDPFECLVRAILGQQVSLAAAATLTDRLVRLAGEALPSGDLFCFPTPESVRRLRIEDLRAIGLTTARAAAVMAAASALIDWDALGRLSGDEAERTLLRIRGVGPWTASYVRLRGLGDRDAFPAADLGVLKAMRRHTGITAARAAEDYAERWRPWRGYAVLCLWDMLHGDAPDITASSA